MLQGLGSSKAGDSCPFDFAGDSCEIMSHGHRTAFRAVARTDLPENWRLPPPEHVLRRTAMQLGLEKVECHVMFLLPDLPDFISYHRWLVDNGQGDYVSVCIQERTTWGRSAPPGSLKRLLESFRVSGCPDMGSLGCIYAPCQDGGSGGGSAAGGTRR